MELIQGRHNKASKFAPQDFDFISNMPDDVISNILNRLPLQEAVRTGILSKNWRYKWTMLSHLVFDQSFYDFLLPEPRDDEYEYIYWEIVSRLLRLLKGAITKFVIYTDEIAIEEDIARWTLFLSRKGVKDLTIWKENEGSALMLPSNLFSCLELKHLVLNNCYFVTLDGFHGFRNLLSLEFHNVLIDGEKFGEFFTQCPMLEILYLEFTDCEGVTKLDVITKLTNLKILTLSLRSFEGITSFNSIFELASFFPKLQELELDFLRCQSFTENDAIKRSSTTFLRLKTLKISTIDLENSNMLSFAFEIIRSSPNLQTLEFMAHKQFYVAPPVEVNYNTMEMLQLQSVLFRDLKGSMNEVRLIKYLLACSPFLKKIVIHPHSMLKPSGKLMFTKKLLELHRASAVAEIKFL